MAALDPSLLLLVKFCTERNHAEEFRRTGAMLMRPLRYFANLDDGVRGDPDEGPRTDAHVFSMYAVTKAALHTLAVGSPLVDERNLRLGRHAALIRDPVALMSRVERALRDAEVRSFRAGLVAYASDGEHADPFEKSDAFAYQSEFRIVVEPVASVPEYRVVLGSLEDICDVVLATDLNRYLRADA